MDKKRRDAKRVQPPRTTALDNGAQLDLNGHRFVQGSAIQTVDSG